MLGIGRSECVYLVPRGHRASAELRGRADRVLRERVPEILPALVEDAFPDTAVYLVERVDVDFAFAADALDDHALAHRWSREILRALGNAVRKGENVLRFDSRAAFVAQYVADLASGRAEGRWYYAHFAPLAALPTASAVRQAIVREPGIAFDVLVELARLHRLRSVIDALSQPGARAVWNAALPEREASVCDPSPALVELLLASWDEPAVTSAIARGSTAHAALHLIAAAIEASKAPLSAAVLRVHADALLSFASMLDAVADPWSLIESIIDGDAATAILRAATRDRITDLATLRFFTRLAAARADLVTCAASTVRSRVTTAASSTSPRGRSNVETVPSRFAGLALLLPSLIDLGIYAEEEDGPLRARLAAECADEDRVLEVLCDPIVRLFSAESPDDDLIRDRRLEIAAAAQTVMQSFAARLPGFANSSPAHLRENFLNGEGAIRFDGARIDVQLPSLPLALVVRIAGMHDRSFEVPWLPDRVVTLRLPEGA